jgi:putative Holliday junction resolvase
MSGQAQISVPASGDRRRAMPKILAVDWGRATLGLAVSDELEITAQGLTSLPRVSESKDLEAIGAYVRDLGIKAIVVGLPKNMDGSLGPSAEAAQEFAHLLRDHLNIPVHLWDERLTSLAAERTLVSAGMRRRARRAVLDQVAATMILQGFLDRQRAMADRGES